MSDRQDRIIQWLWPRDPFLTHHEIARRRSKDSGQWLLDSREFKVWTESEEAEEAQLFCPGGPGSGKTVITSLVVDTLLKVHSGDKSEDGQTTVIAFFYCNKQQRDQTPSDIIRSLLRQFALQLSSIPDTLVDLYQRCHKSSEPPPFANLVVALGDTIAKMKSVYIIIDALDELATPHRRVLLSTLQGRLSTSGIKLFATSRPIPDIVSAFKESPSIDINFSSHSAYMLQYIDESMKRLPEFVQQNEKLHTNIRDYLVKTSNGMKVFKCLGWVRLLTFP